MRANRLNLQKRPNHHGPDADRHFLHRTNHRSVYVLHEFLNHAAPTYHIAADSYPANHRPPTEFPDADSSDAQLKQGIVPDNVQLYTPEQ